MQRLKILGTLFVAVLATVTCSDGPSSPTGDKTPVTIDTIELSELIVSEAVANAGAFGLASVVGSSAGTAYVSLPPGTLTGAVSIRIRNLTAGGEFSGSIPVLDGGFDPVPIAASEGDELELRITDDPGDETRTTTRVPDRRPPVVVRTSPPAGRTDVALSVIPIVVFSEPVEAGSLPTGIRLLSGGQAVEGQVSVRVNAPWAAEYTPTTILEAQTSYVIQVTREVRDLDGDALEEGANVEFTTLPALSNQIVFTSRKEQDGNVEVWVMNVDGSGLVNLTNHPASDAGPAVSPDGTRILFTSDRNGNHEIYVMNADGSGLVNLSNHPATDGGAVWSPDGTRVAFASYRDARQNVCTGGNVPAGGPCFDIFVMNADGSNPINVTNNPSADDMDPSWSPDGSQIAFASKRNDPNWSDVFVMDADGSNVVELHRGFSPAWSPDGSQIAFNEVVSGTIHTWAMSADGSNPVALSSGLAKWPSWSPDGSQIAFTATPSCEVDDPCHTNGILVMNSDGSNPTTLLQRLGYDDQVDTPQAWSP